MDSFDNRGLTIKELVESLQANSELTLAVPDELADEDRKGSLQRRLVSERVGRRYGAKGLNLVKGGTNRNKIILWRVLGRESGVDCHGVPDTIPSETSPARGVRILLDFVPGLSMCRSA